MNREDLAKAKRITERAIKTSNRAIALSNDCFEAGDQKQGLEYLDVAQEATELANYTFALYSKIGNILERQTEFGFVQE